MRKNIPALHNKKKHSVSLANVIEIDDLGTSFLECLNNNDWQMLSLVSKQMYQLTHNYLIMLAFDKFKIFLDMLIINNEGTLSLREAANNIIVINTVEAIKRNAVFKSLLSTFLADKEKLFYPEKIIHHPELTIDHPARLKHMYGEWYDVPAHTTTRPAWTETMREFTVDEKTLNAIYTPAVRYLCEQPILVMGQLLKEKSRATLKKLYQLQQLLTLRFCANNNNLAPLRILLDIQGHRLIYFQLRSWFKDIAHFSKRKNICPLHMAITKQNEAMVIFLIDHGALMDETHVERMDAFLLDALFDRLLGHMLTENAVDQWHPITLQTLSCIKDRAQYVIQALMKRNDEERLILLPLLIGAQKKTVLSRLIPHGFFSNKALLTSLACLHEDLILRMKKKKTTLLLGKYNDEKAAPLRKIFSAQRHPFLFKTIFSYAGIETDEKVACARSGFFQKTI